MCVQRPIVAVLERLLLSSLYSVKGTGYKQIKNILNHPVILFIKYMELMSKGVTIYIHK